MTYVAVEFFYCYKIYIAKYYSNEYAFQCKYITEMKIDFIVHCSYWDINEMNMWLCKIIRKFMFIYALSYI